MNADQALSYIHSIPRNTLAPGLDRIRDLMARLGDPQKQLKFVHIAGTNGKGSTAAMMASVLQKAGYRTGLYTSPFINRFHERIQIDGQMISDEDLAEITGKVKPQAQAMPVHPTEFELVTAMALSYFADKSCDIVVMETGMGGALDATNVIEPPLVSVITNIGLDHTDALGDTLEKIAAVKAGIIKGGYTALYRAQDSVEQVFEDRCRDTRAQLMKADFDSIRLHSHGFEGQVFDACGYEDLQIPLLGAHQLKNAAVVLTAIKALQLQGYSIPEAAVRSGLASVAWPGRFELLRKSPLFLVDGGHNPQCIDALADNVRDYLKGRPLTVVTGVMADKDYRCMYDKIAACTGEFLTVTAPSPRALTAEQLRDYLSRYGKPVTPCTSIQEAVDLAIQKAGTEGVVLTYGSLYMVGDIRTAVKATL